MAKFTFNKQNNKNVRKITIGFSRPKKFMLGAYLIGKWIGRSYSHVFMCFDSKSLGMQSVYHASHGMVHFMAKDNFLINNNIIKEYTISVTDEQYNKILKRAMLLAGIAYSNKELFKTAFYDIARTFGLKYLPSDDIGYICSELVGKILIEELGYNFEKTTCILNPADIDNALTNNNILK